MIINLAEVDFVNDFFSTMLPDGNTLVLNKITESIGLDGVDYPINGINIEIIDAEGNLVECPNVIGVEGDVMTIHTEHKEYEGEVLLPDNLAYCTIEVYE